MMNQSSSAPRRVWYLDLLRILAAYGIILLHYSPLPQGYSDIGSLCWKAVMSVSVLCRWCVPVFLMISGALFLSGQRKISTAQIYKKSILRIAVCFAVWSAFYALAHCVIMNKGKITFLNQFLRGHYHMWYIFAILALYMLTPLLRNMTQSRKLTEYFLILGFLFIFLFPRLVAFVLLFDIPSRDVVMSLQSALAQVNPLPGAHALYYYVLGHYLHEYAVDRKILRFAIPAAAIGYVSTITLTIWHSVKTGAQSGYFYDISSLTVLLFAAGLFVCFRHFFADYVPCKKLERILLRLSACSFGIYLVHPFIIERLSLSLPLIPAVLVLGAPAAALLIFLASFAITALLQKLPVIGRYIV